MRGWRRAIVIAIILLVLFAWAPLFGYAFRGLVIALILLALACAATIKPREIHLRPWWPVLAPLVVLLLWCATSALWSIDADQSLVRLRMIGSLFLGGFLCLIVIAPDQSLSTRSVRAMVGATVFLVFLVLTVSVLTDRAVFRLLTGHTIEALRGIETTARLGAAIAIGTWASAHALWSLRHQMRWRWAAVLVVIGCAGLFAQLQPMAAANVALLMGLAGAAICGALGRRGVTLILSMLAAGVILAPVLSSLLIDMEKITLPGITEAKRSLFHRLFMWEHVTDLIWERPVLGWGLDAARGMPGAKQLIPELDHPHAWYISLHPHNLALQVWLELGAVGAVLVAWLVIGIERMIPERLDRMQIAAIGGSVSSVAVLWMLSFGAWQVWYMAAVFLVAIMLCLGRDAGSSARAA